MAIQFRIDTSGSVIVSPDAASTSAKHVALYLAALTKLSGEPVTYDNESPIKNVTYDRTAHTLSWVESGQAGTQSVTIQNPSLISLFSRVEAEASGVSSSDLADSVATLEAFITQALAGQTSDITSAVGQALTSQTSDVTSAVGSAISAQTESLVSAIDSVDASTALNTLQTSVDAANGRIAALGRDADGHYLMLRDRLDRANSNIATIVAKD